MPFIFSSKKVNNDKHELAQLLDSPPVASYQNQVANHRSDEECEDEGDSFVTSAWRSSNSMAGWTWKLSGVVLVFVISAILFPPRMGSDQSASVPLLGSTDQPPFPSDFVWGAATSSYQVEGAIHEDGRGDSIWDTFCERVTDPPTIQDNSSGAIACDHYHMFHEDILLMKSLNLKAYRFSIAWPRIFPDGTGKVNPEGIAFYNELIDTLLDEGLEPWVTLYHWDLPQSLEDKYEGWLGEEVVDDFGVFARTCFEAYGDRVKRWITINEAWTVAVQGYHDGNKAPGKDDNPAIDVYQAGHNLVLAHARAAKIYKEEFFPSQGGVIGITNCADFRFPKEDTEEDQAAADRAIAFQYAWFTDPFFKGDYPKEMREHVGDRLPQFTPEQQKELMGTTDFLGLNHYSTQYAAVPTSPPDFEGYWADMYADFSVDPAWRKNDMGWSTNPDGCRELLKWLARRYPNVELVMTENGTAEHEPDIETAVADEGRRQYFEDYIRACAQAIADGVPLTGYFAWSLMDNFEWEFGYTKRFGICYVDYETLERTPKSSAIYYSKVIESNGQLVMS